MDAGAVTPASRTVRIVKSKSSVRPVRRYCAAHLPFELPVRQPSAEVPRFKLETRNSKLETGTGLVPPAMQRPLRRGKHGVGRGPFAERAAAWQTGLAVLRLERTGRELWLLPKICRNRADDCAASARAPSHRRRPGAARCRLDL